MKAHPIIGALGKLLPDADFHIAETRDWRSVTFSGQQLVICCTPKNSTLLQYHARLTAILPEHEFAIPGLLVADIVVMPQKGTSLMIEVLVISE